MKNHLGYSFILFVAFLLFIPHIQAQEKEAYQTIDNQTDTIRALAISDDGTLLATAAKDAELKVWDVESGELVYTFTHKEFVQGLKFRPNSKQLVSAGVGGKLRTWNLETGSPKETLETENPKIQCIDFTPDGKNLLTISSKGHRKMIEFWDMDGWKRGKKKEERIDFLSFTPKGIIGIELNVNPYKKRLGFMMVPSLGWKKPGDLNRNDVQHWETGSRRHAMASNGKLMATNLSPTDQILIYDLDQQVQLRKFEGGGQVYALSFDAEGKHLISGSLDGGIRTWNMGTGKILSTTQLPEGAAVTTLVVNAKAQYMVVGDSNGKVYIWKTNQ